MDTSTQEPGTCLHCGRKLSFLQRRLFKQEFCSAEHREAFQQQSTQMALACLQQFAEAEAPAQEVLNPGPALSEVAMKLLLEEAEQAEAPSADTEVPPEQGWALEEPAPQGGWFRFSPSDASEPALPLEPIVPVHPGASLPGTEWELVSSALFEDRQAPPPIAGFKPLPYAPLLLAFHPWLEPGQVIWPEARTVTPPLKGLTIRPPRPKAEFDLIRRLADPGCPAASAPVSFPFGEAS